MSDLTIADRIVVVNDGQFRWGARWGKLRDALEIAGWEHDGCVWNEPEDAEDPYTAICDAASVEPGYEIDATFDDEGLSKFVFSPDVGWGAWEFCPALAV